MTILIHARAERCGFDTVLAAILFVISSAGSLYSFAIPRLLYSRLTSESDAQNNGGAKVSILRIVFPLNECKLNAPFARTFRSRSLQSERL
jgi:hypothetical protein